MSGAPAGTAEGGADEDGVAACRKVDDTDATRDKFARSICALAANNDDVDAEPR